MAFIYFNFGVCLFDFIMLALLSTKCAYAFKQQYPNLRIKKKHWSERMISFIKMLVMFLCPLLNILYAFIFVFKETEVCDRAITKVLKEAVEVEWE